MTSSSLFVDEAVRDDAASSGTQWLTRHADAARSYDAVRRGLGLTDISDWGKIWVAGPDCDVLLETCFAGNVTSVAENAIRVTVLLDRSGRVLSEVQIWKQFAECWVLCPGDRLREVLAALRDCAGGVPDTTIEDRSVSFAALLLEGPDALEAPATLAGPDLAGMALLRFAQGMIAGADILFGRVGFTGEFGYSLLFEREALGTVLRAVRDALPGAVACDPAIQTLLRLEMRTLYRADEVLEDATALECGLRWAIDFRKPAFRGRDAVAAERAVGPKRRLVGFVLDGEPLSIAPRTALTDAGAIVGEIARAALSPCCGKTIGLAMLDGAYGWVGVNLNLAGPDGSRNVRLVSTPFLLTESLLRTGA